MAIVKWPSLQWYDADLKTWLNQHYEPKFKFDLVPIYNVTLAEDTTVYPSTNAYTINLDIAYPALYIRIFTPAQTVADTLWIQTNTVVNQAKTACIARASSFPSTVDCIAEFTTGFFGGSQCLIGGSHTATSRAINNLSIGVVSEEALGTKDKWVQIKCWLSTGPDLKAGTQITVYALEEA